MAYSGLGDGTGGKASNKTATPLTLKIESPAKAAANKAKPNTNNMASQSQGSSAAKSLKMQKGSVEDSKESMLPRQEEGDVAGAVNGVGAFIDGYLRINKRKYTSSNQKRQPIYT